MRPYNNLAGYWKNKFGTRIRKIPLDAGTTCPNRDGTISQNGCIFCNEQGSGTGLHAENISLEKQYLAAREKLTSRHGPLLFAAYLQSFSNTYCSPRRLHLILENLKGLADLKVLCVGTRPDCLDREKAEILASFPCSEVWLDLGLQSSSDKTLDLINRGHRAKDFALACCLAAEAGILVCAHVIGGLPQENETDFLNTIRFLNQLPVSGIKIHNLYICQGTEMEKLWKEEKYIPISREKYTDWVIKALELLRPDIIIHRLAGDPSPGELAAPAWAGEKMKTLNIINTKIQQNRITQGMKWDPCENPAHHCL
ncbi:MAG: TIGR01212 family radical SAM protein [Desulfonatronovibrionaceae bacterium]